MSISSNGKSLVSFADVPNLNLNFLFLKLFILELKPLLKEYLIASINSCNLSSKSLFLNSSSQLYSKILPYIKVFLLTAFGSSYNPLDLKVLLRTKVCLFDILVLYFLFALYLSLLTNELL